MDTIFEANLRKKVDSVCPDSWARLGELDAFPQLTSSKLLQILLTSACQSQHVGNIEAARHALARLPTTWLRDQLPQAVDDGLNLDDDWEYRRLLELVRQLAPDLLRRYVDLGLQSNDIEIRETAEDFQGVGSTSG